MFLEICYGRLFIIGGGFFRSFLCFLVGVFFPLQHFKFLFVHGVLGAIVALDVDAVCSIFFLATNLVCLYTICFFDGFCACMLQQHSFLFICIFSRCAMCRVFGRRDQFTDNRYDSQ